MLAFSIDYYGIFFGATQSVELFCTYFGDLSYVWFLERQPLSLKVLSELYANENATGYAAFERMDCKLIRPEAVALLSIAE